MTQTNQTQGTWQPATQAVRSAVERSQYNEHCEALYLTSSFVQPDAETCAHNFANPNDSYTYTRTANPTVASFETRLAALENAQTCIATATGMSAILLMCMGTLKTGDHVLCSQSMFGSTISLIGTHLARFGIEASFVPLADINAWQAALRPNTKLLFVETPSNPLLELCDMQQLAQLAHQHNALFAVDNCFASPILQRPLELGADIVIHSGTKLLDGQGRVMAGALCCSQALADEHFLPIVRTAGMVLSPFNAWVVLKGLETLSIRVHAQNASALQLAQWLQQHPQVAQVHHPSLPSHPQHQLAMQQQNGMGGSVLSFTVRSDNPDHARQRAFHVIDQTQLCSITANLGDVKTTLSHPASTSHGRLTEEQRQAAGITQNLLRVSVGLEHINDLQTDLQRGLDSLPI